ncbi:MAG TPA: endonuclease/exonuclease/phosphatase family protein [Caulobacteraceae bacterium]|jgi:endonuclease/exonuclease/phosphatase family metal-dependent hydrolase
MTYNVHRCVGVDRRLDVGRVAAVIAQQKPDIVALQELDVCRQRTGAVDQAHAIAQKLGMHFHFHAAFAVEEERYGDALLTAAPHQVIQAGPLPGLPRIRAVEPRGALWLELELDGRRLQVLNTHLGLVPHEQRAQARALAGADWAGSRKRNDPPLIIVGDFNATPYNQAYRILAARFTDARVQARGPGPTPTFPSRLPMLAIDHAFLDGKVRATRVQTVSGPLARTASDHLPLVVDFEFA